MLQLMVYRLSAGPLNGSGSDTFSKKLTEFGDSKTTNGVTLDLKGLILSLCLENKMIQYKNIDKGITV